MKNIDNIYEQRTVFLKVYTDFNAWLSLLGFLPNKSLKSTPKDYHYGHYAKRINDLWGVENYVNDKLKIDLHFLRATDEHKFMIVGEMGSFSDLISIGEFKKEIQELVIKVRNEKQKELDYFSWLDGKDKKPKESTLPTKLKLTDEQYKELLQLPPHDRVCQSDNMFNDHIGGILLAFSRIYDMRDGWIDYLTIRDAEREIKQLIQDCGGSLDALKK